MNRREGERKEERTKSEEEEEGVRRRGRKEKPVSLIMRRGKTNKSYIYFSGSIAGQYFRWSVASGASDASAVWPLWSVLFGSSTYFEVKK